MSYSILYNWQFLKSAEGITPVILIGDNNVTTRVWMGNHWGERRAREWSCLFNFIGVSEEKFMNEIMNMTGKAYQEHWVRNGKWVDDNALVKWAKKACETAADVEEIFKLNPFVYVHAYLSVWDKEDKNTHVQEAFIKDSASLDEWIRSARISASSSRRRLASRFWRSACPGDGAPAAFSQLRSVSMQMPSSAATSRLGRPCSVTIRTAPALKASS